MVRDHKMEMFGLWSPATPRQVPYYGYYGVKIDEWGNISYDGCHKELSTAELYEQVKYITEQRPHNWFDLQEKPMHPDPKKLVSIAAILFLSLLLLFSSAVAQEEEPPADPYHPDEPGLRIAVMYPETGCQGSPTAYAYYEHDLLWFMETGVYESFRYTDTAGNPFPGGKCWSLIGVIGVGEAETTE